MKKTTAFLVALVCAVSATACSRGNHNDPPPESPNASVSAGPFISDPSEAAQKWLTTLLSADTLHDSSPTAAQHRATAWATGDLAKPDPDPVNGFGAQWYELAKVKGRYEVTITTATEDQEPDTQTDAWRMYIATQHPIDQSGKKVGDTIRGIYRIHLRLTERGWRVQEYNLS
ncbi:hypothetical protein GZ176_11880 [Dermatophilus congolensis]|uniref:hypothetical protein n=1 Tax=Dermatophilus congolensis TaxID=1863 RepID=UPI001AAFFD63|nr:hypothetical protein [Dermatophilus congolensis]MBO3146367.1 hypothetical protein [Dermatophilus congolensis]MBO3148590.1 hypothetical protein [Dermatophilus congolensis]MBO3157559.1 hypothetical protein [Dermatophilus congolensis]MBO3159896.1 hypothetical protein [Dermatophilus congolensis]MBO3166635.1 hypothetical protein [Dermatophilus congolensis]